MNLIVATSTNPTKRKDAKMVVIYLVCTFYNVLVSQTYSNFGLGTHSTKEKLVVTCNFFFQTIDCH